MPDVLEESGEARERIIPGEEQLTGSDPLPQPGPRRQAPLAKELPAGKSVASDDAVAAHLICPYGFDRDTQRIHG